MKRSITITIFVILFTLLSVSSIAQRPAHVSDLKGKLVTGGNFGAGMYGNNLYLSLAPQLGFRMTEGLEVGIRAIYNLNYYFDRYYGDMAMHHFGAAAYANYEIYRGLYVHAEDEQLCRINTNGLIYDSSKPRWYNSLFLGAGYRQYVTPRSFAYFVFLYNVNWEYTYNGEWESPYASPIVYRIGYCFGF